MFWSAHVGLALVLILAVVIVVSSDDETPRDAIVGTLIFFMTAGVSYIYCTGFDWAVIGTR